MKKTIAFLLVAVLMISMAASAFARPVAKCPDCNGELISHTTTDWKVKYSSPYIQFGTYWVRDKWEERTDTIKCTNGTHVHTQTRNRVNGIPYSWIQGYFE